MDVDLACRIHWVRINRPARARVLGARVDWGSACIRMLGNGLRSERTQAGPFFGGDRPRRPPASVLRTGLPWRRPANWRASRVTSPERAPSSQHGWHLTASGMALAGKARRRGRNAVGGCIEMRLPAREAGADISPAPAPARLRYESADRIRPGMGKHRRTPVSIAPRVANSFPRSVDIALCLAAMLYGGLRPRPRPSPTGPTPTPTTREERGKRARRLCGPCAK